MRDEGHPRPPAIDVTAAAAARSAIGRLRCVVLVQIAGFRELRRLAGIDRTERLMAEMQARAEAALPGALIAPAGRDVFQLAFCSADQGSIDTAMTTLRAALGATIEVNGATRILAVLFGVAVAAPDDLDEVALLERAEHDLARAGNPDSSAPLATEEDGVLGREIRAAIERDELFLQYQPKLHLRRQAIVSIEALIRWHHPQRGLVMPGDFVAAAERTGDIAAVTLWTIRQAIADQRTLRRNGHSLPIFINISGVLLSDRAFIDDAAKLVRDSGAKLGFEITETSVIRDPESAIRHLEELAAIGVAIAIDDYGAGLSSLAYLKQLPAGELKIDKMFVTQLTSSHRDPLIVRSTIDLAHALEMEVVAEGVETPASLALLSVMGCDLVQGFLISRPLALETLLAYLREERHLDVVKATPNPLGRLAAVRARS